MLIQHVPRWALNMHHIYRELVSRENWLSPVIQATWDARTLGWLWKEGSLLPGRSISVAALWPTCLEGQTEEVKSSSHEDTEDGWLHAARTDGRQFEPSQTPLQPDPVLYTVIVICICTRKPNKKIFKKKRLYNPF